MSDDPLQLFALYPFDTDAVYKKGLENVLPGAVDASSREEFELRARVFYFNKLTGYNITVENAKQVTFRLLKEGVAIGDNMELNVENPDASLQLPDRSEDEPQVLTFAEIKEMISSGRVAEIPNNKIIPDRLNDAVPNVSTIPVREKPWERAIIRTKVGDS